MIKIACDKCNRTNKDISIVKLYVINLLISNSSIFEGKATEDSILCIDCYNKIKLWIKNESGIN
ncbi:MAG: hypothetical protein Q7R52_00015 [archaeon]|nr:hypothetical protein [archaeon]